MLLFSARKKKCPCWLCKQSNKTPSTGLEMQHKSELPPLIHTWKKNHTQETPNPSLNCSWMWQSNVSQPCSSEILSSKINMKTGPEQMKSPRFWQLQWNCSLGTSFLSRDYVGLPRKKSPAKDKFTIKNFKAHMQMYHHVRRPSDETSRIHRKGKQKTENSKRKKLI